MVTMQNTLENTLENAAPEVAPVGSPFMPGVPFVAAADADARRGVVSDAERADLQELADALDALRQLAERAEKGLLFDCATAETAPEFCAALDVARAGLPRLEARLLSEVRGALAWYRESAARLEALAPGGTPDGGPTVANE